MLSTFLPVTGGTSFRLPGKKGVVVLIKIFSVSMSTLALAWFLSAPQSPVRMKEATTVIPAGNEPFAVAVNPVTNRIYLANFGDATVTVIDGATGATAEVRVGNHPTSVAVSPLENKIYVA